MDYKDLLKKAKSELPTANQEHERFELPLVKGHIQGNRTVVSNFHQMAAVLRRDQHQFLKYLLKELATPGELKKNELILGRQVSASMINEKIKKYAKDYVLCKECGKPDTKLINDAKFSFLKCTACGAKYPVK
ncbi:MAG: translation initiation factor IF-2 subunit beta [Candidatus Woesearchaeota archaeon]